MANVTEQSLKYYELIRGGMSPQEAFKQAFPDGIPTAQDRMKEQASAQQKQALGQIGGTLVGALGTAYLVKNVPGWLGTEAAETVGASLAQSGAGAAGAAGSSVAAGAGELAAPELIGATRIGADGLPIAAEGTTLANFAGGATPFIGGATTALGAYGAYEGIKDQDPVTAALGGGGIGLGLNMMNVGLGPYGWAATVGIPLVAALGGKLFDQKSTKEIQREKWGELAENAGGETSRYAQNYLGYLDSPLAEEHARPENRFGYKLEHGTLRPEDVIGGRGLFETLGPDYLEKLSHEQRLALGAQGISENLFGSSKGDITVTNADRLRELMAQIQGGGIQAPQGVPPATINSGTMHDNMFVVGRDGPVPAGMPQLSPQEIKNIDKFGGQLVDALAAASRSRTRSPGIGMDGRRISYG